MKFTKRIHNFFYAVTHANALITERDRLRADLSNAQQENTFLTGRITQNDSAYKKRETALKTALWAVAPENPSFEYLKELYAALSPLANDLCTLQKARISILEEAYQTLSYVKDTRVSSAFEYEAYRRALQRIGVLPIPSNQVQIISQLKKDIQCAVGEAFGYSQLPSNMPIGRIDYLSINGKVAYSSEYQDAGEFITHIIINNYSGEPMSITVYSDPTTGKHIDTSWVKDMDPPPQGFSITPWQEQPEQEVSEQAAPEVDEPTLDYEP